MELMESLVKRMEAPVSWQLGKRDAAWGSQENLQAPAAKPWPQRKRSAPLESDPLMELGFRYVPVPGEFYKREYLVPPGIEKRSRDLTSRRADDGEKGTRRLSTIQH